MVNATSNEPSNTIVPAVIQGRNPHPSECVARGKHHRDSNSLETRSAVKASSINMNGITTGKVDTTTRMNTAAAPSQSSLSEARSGGG